MIMSVKQIANIFREFADKIENGSCGIDVETLKGIPIDWINMI